MKEAQQCILKESLLISESVSNSQSKLIKILSSFSYDIALYIVGKDRTGQ